MPAANLHRVDRTPEPPPNLLAASLTSVSSLVFLQVSSRAFTFVLNQALVRLATPQTFGTATVQFELLLSTTLFLSREGVRTALLRRQQKPASSSSSSSNLAQHNISLLPAYVGVPIAAALAVLYSATSAPAVRTQPHFHLSVSVYALAAALELASEPLYIRAQDELRMDVRVRAEGAAVFSKTLVTFFGLAFASSEWALVAFAAGQAAYALATFVVFWDFCGRSTRYLLRRVTVEDRGR
jgi:oligosaccharide translocation protein RFT1